MKIDRITTLRGAAFALIIATPAAFLNTWFSEQDPKPQGPLALTYLFIVVGFLAGGFVAGQEAEEQRTRHGAMAGLVAFVPIEIIGLIGRTGRGDPISLGSILFLALIAAAAGTLGAFIAARRSGREP